MPIDPAFLSAMQPHPLDTYQDYQVKRLSLQNMRRSGIAQDLANQKAQQEQRDAETMRQVFSSDIPSAQISGALRKAGLPGHAMEWDKYLIDQQKALLDMGKERREQTLFESSRRASVAEALLGVDPAQREAAAEQIGWDGALDDDGLKLDLRLHQSKDDMIKQLNAETAAGNLEVAQQNAGRPQAL